MPKTLKSVELKILLAKVSASLAGLRHDMVCKYATRFSNERIGIAEKKMPQLVLV